ncbi:hypothetical protein QQF64_031481 [Cirrhinus molitorella]|uniref:Sulfotransferase n=1 Tax=Cirrhinus molitorella TaxID=172907 RepID=A0ABR3MX29_9TELE
MVHRIYQHLLTKLDIKESTNLPWNCVESGLYNNFSFDRVVGEVGKPCFEVTAGEKGETTTIVAAFIDVWEDTGHEVERLCSFLGLSTSVEEREKITKGVQFDAMKQNKMTNHATIPFMDFKISPFMRKG